MQGTTDLHYEIADTLLPQTEPVFHDPTAFDTAVDMFDPKFARLQRAVQLSEQQLKDARLTAAQDLAWALINTSAFLFNR